VARNVATSVTVEGKDAQAAFNGGHLLYFCNLPPGMATVTFSSSGASAPNGWVQTGLIAGRHIWSGGDVATEDHVAPALTRSVGSDGCVTAVLKVGSGTAGPLRSDFSVALQ
jgi:hypothetical protein